MRLLQCIKHREGIGLHGRIVVEPVEARDDGEQRVERLQEFRPAIGRAHIVDRLARQPQPVVMVIFVVAPHDAQAMLLVLDIAPQQVIERPQRIDLHIGEGIILQRPADVLEAARNRIHGLDQHSLFLPVRPDELEQARLNQPGPQDAVAIAHLLLELVGVELEVDIAYVRLLDRLVDHLAPNEGKIRKQPGLCLEVEFQVATEPGRQIADVRGHNDAAGDEIAIVLRVATRIAEKTAIRHHERFGRHLDVAVGVSVREGERPPLCGPRQRVLRSAFVDRIAGSDRIAAEHPVHEIEVVLEQKRVRVAADLRPARQVSGREGAGALQGDGDGAGNGRGLRRCKNAGRGRIIDEVETLVRHVPETTDHVDLALAVGRQDELAVEHATVFDILGSRRNAAQRSTKVCMHVRFALGPAELERGALSHGKRRQPSANLHG
ncbi:hypothetical protein D9M72_428580 [compost metagenome]